MKRMRRRTTKVKVQRGTVGPRTAYNDAIFYINAAAHYVAACGQVYYPRYTGKQAHSAIYSRVIIYSIIRYSAQGGYIQYSGIVGYIAFYTGFGPVYPLAGRYQLCMGKEGKYKQKKVQGVFHVAAVGVTG